jgi:flagellar biosynthetic protein FliR
MSALLLSSAALGLVARTVPQMNIFIVAMPLKILIGLFFLGLELPFLASYIVDIFSVLGRNIILLIKSMA